MSHRPRVCIHNVVGVAIIMGITLVRNLLCALPQVKKPITVSLLAAFLLLLLTLPTVASSTKIQIGSVELEVPILNGYCAMDNNVPIDRRVINALKGGNAGVNEVPLNFADCDQLDSWRNGELKKLKDYGYITTPTELIDEMLDMTLPSFKAEMEAVLIAQESEITQYASGTAEQKASEFLKDIKINETINLGVIATDEYALYSGMLHRVELDPGKKEDLLAISGVTLIEQKMVYIILWTNYENENSLKDLQKLTSTWVSSLHKVK